MTDDDGKRKVTLLPTRTPNLLGIKIHARRLEIPGPLTADPVTVIAKTQRWQRPDDIGSCELRRRSTKSICNEVGIVS